MTKLTEKEEEIAELVGAGLEAPEIVTTLATRGRFLARSTLETRIRDIVRKMGNPHDLPPRAVIRLWYSTRHAHHSTAA